MSKLRAAANGQPCIRCYAQDGTICLAHYCGPRQHDYGKGRGIKGEDAAGADLCVRCHQYFDNYESGNTVERSEEFLHLCMLTVIRRFRQGVIRV